MQSAEIAAKDETTKGSAVEGGTHLQLSEARCTVPPPFYVLIRRAMNMGSPTSPT